MDFINKTVNQLTDLFRTMTVGTRIIASLLLVVVVTSLVYLFVFQVHAGSDYLFGARDFSEAELDAMQKAFAAADLNDFEQVGYRIRVPRRSRHQYLQALTQSNFTPENFDSAIDEALNSSSSWFESRQLRDLKVQHATQKKLSRVISAMAGIENATVQYHEERSVGFPATVDRKVTVAVAASGRRPLDAALVRAVRATASGWFGITPENVVVTDLIRGHAYAGTSGADENGAANTVYADTKRVYEKAWRENIQERLSMYPGIVVAVNVLLDNETDNETQKVTYDPQPTSVQNSSYQKTTESLPPTGGRPGSVPNQVPSNAPRELAASSGPSTASSEETRENQFSVAGHEQTVSKKAPLPPRQVTASIGVPRSYFEKVWLQRNPPANGQPSVKPDAAQLRNVEQTVIKDIEDSVINLLTPLPAGANPYPQVQVTIYDDLPPEPVEEPGWSTVVLMWLSDNWHTIALLALGLVSLVMLRSMVRSAAAEPASAEPVAAALPNAAETSLEDELEEEIASLLPRRGRPGGPSLQEELATLVKEAPDAAANVLRTWIGDNA